MSISVILNEYIDERYNPSHEEILDYARFLGMELPEDEEFLFLAREGLKAPLPEPWKPCQTKSGDVYFFNFDTRKSTWEHPCDTYYKNLFKKYKLEKIKNLPLQNISHLHVDTEKLRKTEKAGKTEKKTKSLKSLIRDAKKNVKIDKANLEKELEQDFQEFCKELKIKCGNEKMRLEKKFKGGIDEECLKKIEDAEKRFFEFSFKEKVKEMAKLEDKTLRDLKKKYEKKSFKVLSFYSKQLQTKSEKAIENYEARLKIKIQELDREIEDSKKELEKIRNENCEIENRLKGELDAEENRQKNIILTVVNGLKKNQKILTAFSNADRQKSLETLKERIKELKERYQEKEKFEIEKINEDYEEKLREISEKHLAKDSIINTDSSDIYKNNQLILLESKYNAQTIEELKEIDRIYEEKAEITKKLLKQEYNDKAFIYKEIPKKSNNISFELKSLELQQKLSKTLNKIKYTQENIEIAKKTICKAKEKYATLKIDYNLERERTPNIKKISKLRKKIQEKEKKISYLKSVKDNNNDFESSPMIPKINYLSSKNLNKISSAVFRSTAQHFTTPKSISPIRNNILSLSLSF